MRFREYLINLMARMTKSTRYFPDIVWSKTQIVHNIFRAYEYFFGRAFGPNGVGDTIRKEAEVQDVYKEKVLVKRKFTYHTLEARLSQYEANIKNFVLCNPVLMGIFAASSFATIYFEQPLFLFIGAIAYGGSLAGVTTTQAFTTVAISGSDTVGIAVVADGTGASNAITSGEWGAGNAVSLINEVKVSGGRFISAWYRIAPASSATLTWTGGAFWRSTTFYYTGAHQTTPIDSSATNTAASGTTIGVAIDPVASNCWTVVFAKDELGDQTYTTDVGAMLLAADAGGLAIADSNGTVGTGSATTTLTGSTSSFRSIIGFSLAPAGASTTVKTYNGTTTATTKSVLNGTVIANRKTWNSIA